MNVMNSQAQPELIYVVLVEDEAKDLRKALKGAQSTIAKDLRKRLGVLLNGK